MEARKNVRLIQLRQKEGWTQKSLGDKVGLSQSMIAHIESGSKEPSRKYRIKIAKLFDVSVEWLFYEQVEDLIFVGSKEGGSRDALSREATISDCS